MYMHVLEMNPINVPLSTVPFHLACCSSSILWMDLHPMCTLSLALHYMGDGLYRAPMLSRSNSVSSRRSLQLQQSQDSEKQYKVNLPDNQVS